MQELLGLALQEATDRDSRPRRDDGRDVLCRDLVVDHEGCLRLGLLGVGDLALDDRDLTIEQA